MTVSRFALFAGYRSFSQARQSRLVSFISMLAIIGLVFGITLLIVVFSIMNGFDREMRTRILGQVPHIQIFKQAGGIYDWPPLQLQLEAREGINAAQPYIRLEGLLSGNGRAVAVEVEGLELSGNPRVKQLIPASSLQSRGLYLASGVADQLGLNQGDRVALLIPETPGQGGRSTSFKAQGFSIAGVFETKTSLDQYLVITDLDNASELAGIPGAVQGFQLQVDDIFNTRQLGYQLLRELPPGFSFNDWLQSHGNLYQAIKMSRNLVSLLVLLIMGIAVFNVVSMLVMTVVDKKSAIAIYKTLGATRGEIMTIFIVQGLLIGLVGTFLGVIAGIALTLNLDGFVMVAEKILGRPLLDPTVYPVSFLPVQLRWTDLTLIAGVSFALNLVATLYPAWKAAGTRPAWVLSQD